MLVCFIAANFIYKKKQKHGVVLQCESEREALCDLHAEVQQWQQEAQAQREIREKEVKGLRSELREEQSRFCQHRANVESLHRELESTQRQQRDTEDEVNLFTYVKTPLPWCSSGVQGCQYIVHCVRVICCPIARSPIRKRFFALRARS